MSFSFPRHALALAIATGCGSADDASPSDTDATTSPTTSSPTSMSDDTPPLDSTDGGPGTVGPGTVAPDTDTDPSGMTEGPTDGSGSTDEGPMGCTSDDECTEADAPFCVQMICSPCSAADDPDAACAEKFPETPACEASTCVQCAAGATGACTGTTPICDTDANSCVGCTTHDECPDSACHIPYPDRARATDLDGACFDPTTVVHVDGDGGQAFTTIQAAVNAFDVGEEGVIIVHDAPSYDEAVSVTSNRVLAIMAASGETPQWVQTDTTGSQLSITDTSTTVFLDRMRLAGNLDGTVAAVTLSNGRVHAQRTAIVGNNGGGISADNGALVYLENSFVGGGDGNNDIAVMVTASTALVTYTTLGAGFGTSAGLSCDALSTVTVRNSIIVSYSTDPELQCDATVTYTATESMQGGTNTTLNAMSADWFIDFDAGDFHLDAAPAAVATTAQWQTGDPLTDIDGQPRPNTDGAMDYAGADVP